MAIVTGLIKVVKLPSGEAPEWVRLAWLGLTLPCCPDGCNRNGVSVPQDKALKILRVTNRKAADWFEQHGFPKPPPDDCFGFGDEEVQILSGVTPFKIDQFLGVLEIGR